MVRARGRTPAPPAGDGGADLEVGRAAVGIGVLSLAVPPGPGRGTADQRGPGCMLGLLGPARTGTRRGRVHGVRRHRRDGLIDAAGTARAPTPARPIRLGSCRPTSIRSEQRRVGKESGRTGRYWW